MKNLDRPFSISNHFKLTDTNMTRTICLLAAALFALALVGCKPTEDAKTTAQVRVLHVSPDTEALTVKIAAGATKVASVASGAASGYVAFDAASTAYEVRSLTDNTLLAARTVALTGGSRYTLNLYGRRAALGAGGAPSGALCHGVRL